MRNARQVLWAAAAVAVLACDALAAPDGDLASLLHRLPADCVAVVGSPDAPAALGAVRRWTAPLLQTEDEETVAVVNSALDSVVQILSGPVVVGFAEDATPCLLARTGKTQAEVMQLLEDQGLDCNLDEGTIVLSIDGPGECFLQVKGGLLAEARDRAALDGILSPSAGQPLLLDTPEAAALLRADELQKAPLFAFKKRWLPEMPQGRGMSVVRRSVDALVQFCHIDAPLLVCLQLGENGIRLTGAALLPQALPGGAGEDAGNVPALPDALPERSWGWVTSPAAVVDHVGQAMAAFDPDVAAEFRQELAELNTDLGYDFQHDFLGNLGPGWACALLPAGNGGPQEWFCACGVRDAEKLVRCARAMARLGEEPWDEGAPEAGFRRFTTRAFTVPLELAVGPKSAFLAGSPHALRRALELAKGSETLQPHPGVTWEAHSVVHAADVAAGLVRDEMGDAMAALVLSALSRLRTTVDVRRLPERLEFELRLDGITPAQLNLLARPAAEMLP